MQQPAPRPSDSTLAEPQARLTEEDLARFAKEFSTTPQNRLMQNAVSKTAVDDVALDRDVVTSIDHTSPTCSPTGR